MAQQAQSPRDLSERLHQYLAGTGQVPPAVEDLVCLLEIAFFASMQTEESLPIRCTLAFMDPKAPDPQPPSRIRPHRWTVTPFAQRVPLSMSSLTKLAPVAPPDAGSIAVFVDASREPFAWGLTDQALHDANARDCRAARTFERPGRFQIELSGVGEISVYHSHRLVAVLRKNEILGDGFVVLRDGPVHEKLVGYLARHEEDLRRHGIDKELYGPLVFDSWTSTLSRVLNDIKRYRRGGALLLLPQEVPETTLAELNCKYSLNYDRLAKIISMSAQSQYRLWCAEEDIEAQYQDHDPQTGALQLSYADYNETACRASENKDCLLALDGCIAFIAALSRIDGLILMRAGLSVTGFGVEILTKDDPKTVTIAGDEKATPSRRRTTSIEHYGTRHRSMLRFCNAHPEAVGFVVSHDGDIRAITRVGNEVVLWENIHLYSMGVNPRISAGGTPQGRLPASGD